MPGNVRRAVSIDSNHCITLLAVFQTPAPILGNCIQVGLVHVKPFSAHLDDLRIDLKAVNRQWTVHRAGLGCRSSGCQSYNPNPLHLLRAKRRVVEVWSSQELLPRAQEVLNRRMPERVDTLAFVEAQHAEAI